MTQAQTGATFQKGRLLRSAAVSAFALSALAGGAALSGGEAKAASCTAITPTGNDCTFTDFFGTVTDKLTVIQQLDGLDTDKAHLSLTLSGNPNLWPLYQTTIDNNQAATALITGTGIYQIDKTGPAWFDKVQLRVEPPSAGSWSVTKTICSAPFGVNGCTGTDYGSLTVSDANTNPVSLMLTGTPTTIYVKDTVTGVGVAHINNDFRQTPGPLPILGAGAAFGFSRKLRSRIKAARTV